MGERTDDWKLDWLCRVSADLLAPCRPDLHQLICRILREVYAELRRVAALR